MKKTLNTFQIYQKEVGPFLEHTYLIGDKTSKEAILIDPGDSPESLLTMIEESGFSVQYILNTHGHIDHVGAVQDLREHLKVSFGIHELEVPLIHSNPAVANFYNLPIPKVPEIDFYLEEGQKYSFGEYSLEVIHVPGHTQGHVILYVCGHAFVGDCIFLGSIGRTDLPGGDHKTLLQSIQEKIFTLPEDTILYPGHGSNTTVKHEKKHNPFFI